MLLVGLGFACATRVPVVRSVAINLSVGWTSLVSACLSPTLIMVVRSELS